MTRTITAGLCALVTILVAGQAAAQEASYLYCRVADDAPNAMFGPQGRYYRITGAGVSVWSGVVHEHGSWTSLCNPRLFRCRVTPDAVDVRASLDGARMLHIDRVLERMKGWWYAGPHPGSESGTCAATLPPDMP